MIERHYRLFDSALWRPMARFLFYSGHHLIATVRRTRTLRNMRYKWRVAAGESSGVHLVWFVPWGNVSQKKQMRSHRVYEKTSRKSLAENPWKRTHFDAQCSVLKID